MRQVHWLNLICFFFADAALSVDAGPRVSYVTDDGDETVSIPSGSDDGAEPESIDRAEFPEYEVLRSHSRKRYVRKAPELPGLPPVEGEVTVTCELVFEPQFIEEPVEPREPSKELDSEEEPVVETEDPLAGEVGYGTDLVLITGQVYDHSRSLIHLYPNGNGQKSIVCWSNLNLNHFQGFPSFRVTARNGSGRDYGLLISSSGYDTDSMRARAQREGRRYDPPDIPDLPNLEEGGPAFVIVEGKEENDEAVVMLERLHRLYWSEGARTKVAHEARVRAREERRAYLLANPPKPKDVRIRFGKRDTSSGQANSTEEK